VNTIALLCLVLLCTPVQLDCSLVALQADLLLLLWTPLLCKVLRLCRPTLRIHSWSLQHTPARTYCSPSSCMRLKSRVRLPCQLISIILLTISISFLILRIDGQLRLPCRLLVLYCSPLAVLVPCCSSLSSCDLQVNLYYYTAHLWAVLILYCSSLSSGDFHVDLYIVASLPLPLYCEILLLAKQHKTIQGLSCGITADFDCGIMPILLQLDCRLNYSSHRTNCGITSNLSDLYTAHRWVVATSLSSYIFIVTTMPLPSCGITAGFHLRSQALATSLLSYNIIVVHCGNHSDLWLTATFPLLWDLAASFDKAVRAQTLSLFLWHNRRLVAASLPTSICAHRRLRHHCCLTTSLSFITAIMPTCG
jgi:hypothetical protein